MFTWWNIVRSQNVNLQRQQKRSDKKLRVTATSSPLPEPHLTLCELHSLPPTTLYTTSTAQVRWTLYLSLSLVTEYYYAILLQLRPIEKSFVFLFLFYVITAKRFARTLLNLVCKSLIVWKTKNVQFSIKTNLRF